MSARVRVLLDGGGLVAVKHASTPSEVGELAHEAEMVLRAAHPGVVALLDHRTTRLGAELRTRYVGQSLARWHGDLARLAGLGASVAATLADLHELGIVHGRLDASHVLLGPDGRPTLCGLSHAGESDASSDVAGLGRLLEMLLERIPASDRRGTFAWRRGPVAERRALAQVLARATDPVPDCRPGARALAGMLLRAVPDAELPPSGPWTPAAAPTNPSAQGVEPVTTPSDVDPALFDGLTDDSAPPDVADPDDELTEVFGDQSEATFDDLFIDRPWSEDLDRRRRFSSKRRPTAEAARRRRHTRALTGCAVVVVAAMTYLLVQTPTGDGGAAPYGPGDDPIPTDPLPTTDAGCAAGAAGRDRHAQVDVDGDGCGEPLELGNGIVRVGEERWAVGQSGDAVAIGDWDCDGAATPAVYRPSTGDVFVFTDWADPGHPLAVESTARLPGGTTLSASATSEGCDQPVVRFASGDEQVVELDR